MNFKKSSNKKLILSVLCAYSVIYSRYNGGLKKCNSIWCLTLRRVLKNWLRHLLYSEVRITFWKNSDCEYFSYKDIDTQIKSILYENITQCQEYQSLVTFPWFCTLFSLYTSGYPPSSPSRPYVLSTRSWFYLFWGSCKLGYIC